MDEGRTSPSRKYHSLNFISMENISLLAAKSQIEEMQRLVEKYERMGELCGNTVQGDLYRLAATKFSERIGKFRKLVAEKELAIVRKEVAVC